MLRAAGSLKHPNPSIDVGGACDYCSHGMLWDRAALEAIQGGEATCLFAWAGTGVLAVHPTLQPAMACGPASIVSASKHLQEKSQKVSKRSRRAQKAPTQPASGLPCSICFSELDPTHDGALRLEDGSCAHVFCGRCAASHVRHSLAASKMPSCPTCSEEGGRRVLFSLLDIQLVAALEASSTGADPQQLVEKFESVGVQEVLAPLHRVHCGCGAVLTAEPAQAADERAVCPHCGGQPVLQAKLRQRQDEKKLQRYMQRVRTIRCSGCGMGLQKADGCNKITCSRCGALTCWGCGGALPKDCPYDHFSRPPGKCKMFG